MLWIEGHLQLRLQSLYFLPVKIYFPSRPVVEVFEQQNGPAVDEYALAPRRTDAWNKRETKINKINYLFNLAMIYQGELPTLRGIYFSKCFRDFFDEISSQA